MILKAFAIYDGKGLCYGVPFFMSQNGQAVRGFSDLVNDPQTSINRHPGDYVLYQIGEFDDSDGKLTTLVPQLLLGQGVDFVRNVFKNEGMNKLDNILHDTVVAQAESGSNSKEVFQ